MKNAKESKFSKRVSPLFFFSKNKNYYVNYDQLLTQLHNARVVTCGCPNIPKRENIIILGKDSRKQEFFWKGWSIVLAKNSQFFCSFSSRKNTPGKCVWEYFRKKKPFPNCKNKKLKQSKHWDVSKRVSPWFCPKMGNFSIFLFKAK